MRKGKGYLFRACGSKGVRHHHLHLVETPRQAEEMEKRKAFTYFLIGGCWIGEAGSELTSTGNQRDWFGKHTWLSLLGPTSEAGQKKNKKNTQNKILSVTDEVLTIWGRLLEIVVWLPGMVAADSGLANPHWFLQSNIMSFKNTAVQPSWNPKNCSCNSEKNR